MKMISTINWNYGWSAPNFPPSELAKELSVDQLAKRSDRRDVMEARIAEEHARHRLRIKERIDFLERLDRDGRRILVPVIRRRSPAGRLGTN